MYCFHILVPLLLALQYLLMQLFRYLDFSTYEPPAGDCFNILLLKFEPLISFNTLMVIHTLQKYFFLLQVAPVLLNNLAPCSVFHHQDLLQVSLKLLNILVPRHGPCSTLKLVQNCQVIYLYLYSYLYSYSYS